MRYLCDVVILPAFLGKKACPAAGPLAVATGIREEPDFCLGVGINQQPLPKAKPANLCRFDRYDTILKTRNRRIFKTCRNRSIPLDWKKPSPSWLSD
jgi:hypothetical protein